MATGEVGRGVARRWSPNETGLERYARTHIAYEVRSLVEQAIAFGTWGNATHNETWDALLEAIIVHSRLMHDFLRSHRSSFGMDVLATQYVPGFPTTPTLLTGAEKRDANQQVAHLSASRLAYRPWPVGDITTRAVDLLADFHSRLSRTRSPYFVQIPGSVARWRRQPASVRTATS